MPDAIKRIEGLVAWKISEHGNNCLYTRGIAEYVRQSFLEHVLLQFFFRVSIKRISIQFVLNAIEIAMYVKAGHICASMSHH